MQKFPIIVRIVKSDPNACSVSTLNGKENPLKKEFFLFIYLFLLIHLTNKVMNKNEEIVSNTVTKIIIIMGKKKKKIFYGLSAGSVAGMDNNNKMFTVRKN
jgi:hypothetical protein